MDGTGEADRPASLPNVSASSVFLIFLRLGCTSFGGPIAHLGYFRDEFVYRRQWLTESEYADLVALAQFLPGPASSQTGFALGLQHAGLRGGLAAFVGFTLPSALLMLIAVSGLTFAQGQAMQGAVHGLKLLAVAVVAQAVWSMGRTLCPDRIRASFAFAVAALLIALPSSTVQLAAIVSGAFFGSIVAVFASVPRPGPIQGFALQPRLALESGVGITNNGLNRRSSSLLALSTFALLLAVLPSLAQNTERGTVAIASAFYQTGALVFGGGHVILPLLERSVVLPGWVSHEDFFGGYGAAQALPGPLFTFAAFLGAKASIGPGGLAGALTALIAIFLPGMLLMYGALPFWDALRRSGRARAALDGVNAAVVGILGAALYYPLWTSTVLTPLDAAVVLLLFAAVAAAQLPVPVAVVLSAMAGMAISRV